MRLIHARGHVIQKILTIGKYIGDGLRQKTYTTGPLESKRITSSPADASPVYGSGAAAPIRADNFHVGPRHPSRFFLQKS